MKKQPKQAAPVKSDAEPLTPADIRRIRESLGLNQVEAGELLGGGIRAFQKYESGTITPAATTISLLRILDADPTALGALTGTHVPIQQTGLRPFEITGAHISALTDRFLVVLTRRLLAAEAARNRVPPDNIHVASVLTAADGGEDARITWENGPERTPYLPSRNCILQVKAAAITPAKAAKDVLTTAGDLEPVIRETLEAGGNYIMLCNRAYVGREVVKRAAAVLEAVQAQGVAAKAAQIAFRDADQIAAWVNEHPQVATWIQEQTQPGLATTFRTYTHWAGRYEHETPFVDDDRLAAVRAVIKPVVEKEREVVRIVGLSGVGKSRLVLEALADDEKAGFRTSDLVLYGVETELGSTAVKGAMQSLADLGKRAVVVVDRCSEETHQDLAAMVKRSSSRLSLITIDHEVPSGPTGKDLDREGPVETLVNGTLLIKPAKNSVIEALIKSMQPGLPTEDVRRLVKFAGGFPQMAVLSAEAWVADISLATVTQDFLIEQVVVGRRATNKQELLQSAKLLSVFGLVGFRDEAETELAQVAALAGTLSEDQLRATFVDLARRRVAQPRGRFLTIQPRPIAHSLAERQWQEWGPQKWDELLTQAPPVLRRRAAKQLALLNRSSISLDVTQHLCRIGGPLDSYEAICDSANAGVVDSLSEIDARATGELLERVFDTLPEGALKHFDGDARGEIRWAVQRIAFVPETFELGARLLFRLAMGESESWGNNCTGQFKSLFPAYLGDTAADGDARLALLDDLIDQDIPEQNALLVAALDSGAEVQHFSRSVGIESHGLRKALEPWNPSNKVAVDYILDCLERLLRFALVDDPAGEIAKKTIANDIRGLILAGFLDFVEKTVTQLVQAQGRYWPQAMASLGDVISYDGAGMTEEDLARVFVMLAMVSPDDLRGKLKLLVTEMPWDYPCDEKLGFNEREDRQQEAIVELAAEALAQPEVLIAGLPALSTGDQRMAGSFGTALAATANDKVGWLWRVMRAYRAAPAERQNPDLLTSYLAELAKTKPRLVETFKRRAIRSPKLASNVPLLAFKMEIPASDILLVCEGLKTGTLTSRALYAWTFGGRLAKRQPDEVAPLFSEIFAEPEQANLGYDLMGMYVHSDMERLEFLRPQLRLAADTALAGQTNTMNDHHFIELMKWLLKKGRNDADARAAALSLTRQLIDRVDEGSLSDERRIKPLLPLLLREFPEIVWPLIGNAITSDPRASWRFQHALGKGYSFGGSQQKAPIEELSEDTLLAWCHANPDVAPAFLARILPLLTSEGEGQGKRFSSLIQRIVDEFGERDDVQQALVGNMHTFGWSGSLTTYYELYEGPLAALHKHAKAAVRRWSKKMSDSMAKQIAREHDSDDEQSAQYD
jgi:DNA-binding transcriptional regulator YiaG